MGKPVEYYAPVLSLAIDVVLDDVTHGEERWH